MSCLAIRIFVARGEVPIEVRGAENPLLQGDWRSVSTVKSSTVGSVSPLPAVEAENLPPRTMKPMPFSPDTILAVPSAVNPPPTYETYLPRTQEAPADQQSVASSDYSTRVSIMGRGSFSEHSQYAGASRLSEPSDSRRTSSVIRCFAARALQATLLLPQLLRTTATSPNRFSMTSTQSRVAVSVTALSISGKSISSTRC